MNGFFSYFLIGKIQEPDIVIIDEAHNLAETSRKCKSMELHADIIEYMSGIDTNFRDLISRLNNQCMTNKDDIYVPEDEDKALKLVYRSLNKIPSEMERVREQVLQLLYSFRDILSDCNKANIIKFTFNEPKFYHVIKTIKNNLKIFGEWTNINADKLKLFIKLVDSLLNSDDDRNKFVSDFSSNIGTDARQITTALDSIMPVLNLLSFLKDLEDFKKLYTGENDVLKKTGIAYNSKNNSLSICRLFADIAEAPVKFTGTKQTIFMSGTILGAKKYAEELGLATDNMVERSMISKMEPVLYSGQRILIPLNVCSLRKMTTEGEPSYEERLRKSFWAVMTVAKKHRHLADAQRVWVLFVKPYRF